MGWFSAPGILGLFAEFLLKTTLVLILAALAAAASKRRPAAFRHFVLSSALIGLLLLPVFSLAPVGWKTSLLPARPASMQAREVGQNVRNSFPEGAEVPEPSLSVIADGASERGSAIPSLGARLEPRESTTSPPLDHAFSWLPDARTSSGPRSVLYSAIIALWSAGFVILVLRLGIGLSGAVKLTREGTILTDPVWHLLFERFLALVSLRRKIRLKSHPQVFVPLTWGWRKPVILMPSGTDVWTDEERSAALFHELSHVKRADFLVMLLVRTSLAVFWWNPLSWIVYRKLRKEQEIACDELVLRAGIKPSTYAASLLVFRRSAGFRWNTSAALLGMLGKPSFNERLANILRQKLMFKEVKMKTKIMLAAAVVLAVAFVGTARPAVGVESAAVEPTAFDTAAPAPGSVDIQPPAVETQEKVAEKEAVQEKEKEKAKVAEKEKSAVEKKIVFEVKEGAKTPIEITITQGNEVKTLTLDKPLTITSGKDGRVLILSSEGKEIEVLKGEPLRLEIKGGGFELVREGKVRTIEDLGVYKAIKEGANFVLYINPKCEVLVNPKLEIIKEGKDEKGDVHLEIRKVVESKPRITTTWTLKEPVKEGTYRIVKEFSGKPFEGTWISEDGKTHVFSITRDKELLEKVREIREQVAAVKEKKTDFSSLEKSLEKLEEMLKPSEKRVPKLGIEIDKEPGVAAEVKKIVKEEVRPKIGLEIREGVNKATVKTVTTFSTDDDATSVVLIATGKTGLVGREAYNRAAAKLKNELPEGTKLLEQNYDEEAGTMTFKFAAPKGKRDNESLIRKLVDSLRAEIIK